MNREGTGTTEPTDWSSSQEFLETAREGSERALLEIKRRAEDPLWLLDFDEDTLKGFLGHHYGADSNEALIATAAQYLLREPTSPQDTLESRKAALRKAVGQ
jgi:hypothetical protein